MILKQFDKHLLLQCRTRMGRSRILLLLFILVQACDGLFTFTAVRTYGIAAEGNMVLATWMMLIGPLPTLFVAKMVASAGGVLLHRRGIHRTLALLTLLYVFGAIGPWIVVFQTR